MVRWDVLNTVGSALLLWFDAGRIWLDFSTPERVAPDEFIVDLSLLHFVVKGVQSIERDECALRKVGALRLVDKRVGYNQYRVAETARTSSNGSAEKVKSWNVFGTIFIENGTSTTSRWGQLWMVCIYVPVCSRALLPRARVYWAYLLHVK